MRILYKSCPSKRKLLENGWSSDKDGSTCRGVGNYRRELFLGIMLGERLMGLNSHKNSPKAGVAQ